LLSRNSPACLTALLEGAWLSAQRLVAQPIKGVSQDSIEYLVMRMLLEQLRPNHATVSDVKKPNRRVQFARCLASRQTQSKLPMLSISDPSRFLPFPLSAFEDTRLVPIILDLVTAQDIEKVKAKGMRSDRSLDKIVRLFQQAYEQGAVLGHADVSLLLNMTISRISTHVLTHERATGKLIPRRGTVHDIGRSVTHKAIICYKSLVEKKPTSQVAQETFHSPEDVERYVQCFRRIQMCRDKGLTEEEIAQATGHSLGLVKEYLDLIRDFQIPPLSDPSRKENCQSTTKPKQK
jgi:hypothetical protein